MWFLRILFYVLLLQQLFFKTGLDVMTLFKKNHRRNKRWHCNNEILIMKDESVVVSLITGQNTHLNKMKFN